MISPVWLIADRKTLEVSYIQHGREGDEQNWRWIGPFAFTSLESATLAAATPTFLPHGVEAGDFTPLEVDAASFIRAVYNGFPPQHTDVFVLDQALLPLTVNGAAWIDEATGSPVWAPLFDEDAAGVGLDWLDRVLEVVATSLGMSMETVQVIGTMNAAEEDAAEVEQTRSLIQQHIRVALTPEPGTLQIGDTKGGKKHQVTPQAKFWLHTTGLTKLGLPELEIRNVPVWWVKAAGEELLTWAAYSLDHGISEGDVLQTSGPIPLGIAVSLSDEDYWTDHPTGCLRLVVVEATFIADRAGDQVPESENLRKMMH